MFKKLGVRMWIGFIWLKMGSTGRLTCAIGFHVEGYLVSRLSAAEGLCSVEEEA
jgi:hypothetical protein